MNLTDFIQHMPKAELHVHLEGTMEPELRFALAERNNINLPYKSKEEMLEAYTFHDLPSFLAIYYAAMNVLQTEDDFYQLTYDYLKRAKQDNIIYCELFFDPQAHTSRGIDFETVITGINRAQQEAKQLLGVRSQLIMCFLRDMSAESAMEHLHMAIPFMDWLVGVGLDSDEKGNPPLKFEKVFALARKLGLKLTMHCDVNQENTLLHLEQCLEDIQVDRIDHGVNALEDEEIVSKLVQRQLGLTVCPVSNQFVVQSLTSNEIRAMLDKGLRVMINSDDPAYFRAYLNDNLIALQQEGAFSADEITTLVENSFHASWLSTSAKQAYLSQLNSYCLQHQAISA